MRTSWTKRLLAGGTLLGAATVGVIQYNEGYSPKAYYDGARVLTICYGETANVKPGEVRTKSQCDEQLKESIADHARVFEGIPYDTPDVTALGVIDMAYNIGVAGFNESNVKRLVKSGNLKAAGDAVLAWKYISRYQKNSPGKGWVHVSGNRWRYDCSTPRSEGNKWCSGLWDRRQWQKKAIANEFKTPQEALDALKWK